MAANKRTLNHLIPKILAPPEHLPILRTGRFQVMQAALFYGLLRLLNMALLCRLERGNARDCCSKREKARGCPRALLVFGPKLPLFRSLLSLHHLNDDFLAPRHFELLENCRQVVANRGFAQEQLLRDVAIAKTLRDQFRHFPFARR